MTGAQKYILVPAGSSGDINPFVWLGTGLASLGHEVVVVVHRPFDHTMEAAGLRTATYGTEAEYQQIIRHPDLWHPQRGFALIASMARRSYPDVVPRIRAEIEAGRTLLLGAGIAFGARIAAEAFRVPLVTVQLQPAVFMSVEDPPILQAGMEWFHRTPRWLRRLLYRFGYFRTDRLLAGGINAYRADLGLVHPVRHILGGYWNSPLAVLALFPEWFGAKRSDWPRQTFVTRFPLYDESNRAATPSGLERFIADGPPPILFTPGSANLQARRFFEVGAAACRTMGRRAVFVTPYAEQLPSPLPPDVRHCPHAPFSQLFPRCSAVVHHGGIGTVSQGLAAGVPQLVMAMSHDQPDNGYRLARLGVGAYLYPKAFTAERVAATLIRLTASAAVAEACRACRGKIERQMPAETVFRLLEDVHRRALA